MSDLCLFENNTMKIYPILVSSCAETPVQRAGAAGGAGAAVAHDKSRGSNLISNSSRTKNT